MAATTKKDYITFSNGINTETNHIKEEEGTCSEISNFRINKDGSIEKRGGLLPKDPLIPSISTTKKPQAYLWKNVAGNPEDNFYVVKQGATIHFFNANEGFNKTTKKPLTVLLNLVTTPGYTKGDDIEIKMTDGEGLLFISGKTIEPLVVSYDKEKNILDVESVKIKIRDYIGMDDGIDDVTYYPSSYRDNLSYNLLNQGFSSSDVSQFFTENGYLPSKADMVKYYKYTKISTDYKDPKKPVEIYDYQLSLENNFGSSRAPIGRSIIDVFKTTKKINESKIGFRISKSNLIDFKCNSQTAVFTFVTNRIPSVPLNQFMNIEVKQTGFDVHFPPRVDGITVPQNFGATYDYTYQTPMVASWKAQNKRIELRPPQIFQEPDAPWSAHAGTTEAEYKQARFLWNNCIMVRNTGEKNEYVMIADYYMNEDYFKKNLVDDLGGTIEAEFDLPVAWNLPDNQKGKYIRITTNAKTDNLYLRRIVTQTHMRNFYRYHFTNTTGSMIIDDFRDYAPVIVRSEMAPSTETQYQGKIKMRYISDNLAELHVGSRLNCIDDKYLSGDKTLPIGYNNYRFNYHTGLWNDPNYEGRELYGLDDIMSSITWTYTVSGSDKDVFNSEEDYRPSTVAFYANRVFYSAFESDIYSNHIFFSQMKDLQKNAGKCYTFNDPTSEYENAVLDTDGGYISLPEADEILDLVVVKDKLLVLARNSVYAIFGDPFFKATSYIVRKVADIGMVNKGTYALVGDTIVFASDDGLYNFNIDELNGDLLSTNFSNAKIKTIYNSLEEEQKKNIKLTYNPYEKKLSIMLNRNTALAPDVYDTILHYDFDLQAFYMYDIEQYGNLQIVDFFQEYIYNKQRPNSLLYYDNTTGDYGTLVENYNQFKDFEYNNPTPISCALETNYINFNDVMRTKQIRRLHVYADNDKASHCNAFVKYDSSIVPSKKWSKSEDIFRLQGKTKGEVHMHQQVCRGSGLFFKLRFESNVDKPCKILGWTMLVEGNQQV